MRPDGSFVTGTVHLLGDNIDTDMLAPGGYLHLGIETLKNHCLEAIDPDWSSRVSPGDIVVAGRNFGCGSSREQAAIVLKELGIALVLARSFARIFYRNAINVGLPIGIIKDDVRFAEGERVNYSLERKEVRAGQIVAFTGVTGPLKEILDSGGLVQYVAKELKNAEKS
ncbi:3-isopropylmalate dehydratase [Thermoplasmatales archaeon AK]|nr:3-isopropylmalate dehydratase [Thermoplasmatales archaeon AK]